MQKPPGTLGVKRLRNSLSLILSQKSTSIKPSNRARSLPLQQPGGSLQTFPPLPERLDKLIDLPWTKEASREIDLWLWYTQQEFEMTGGSV